MKWRELRGFYFPLCMEETSKAKAKYGALIQQLQKTRQSRSVTTERSPFLQSLLDDLAKRAKESPDDYDF